MKINTLPRFVLSLLFLAIWGCQTEMPGQVELTQEGRKIPLINSKGEGVLLGEGPNVAKIGIKTVTLTMEGRAESIRFPFGLYPKDNFYYSAEDLKQPVDLQGSTQKRYGQVYTRIESRSCQNEPGCSNCTGYYQVEVTSQEVFKNSRFEFYFPPHAELLGHFQEKGERRYEETIRERQLTYCHF